MALTTTREFRWDDPGAPVLNGEAGSFYALMKTCLGGTGVAYGTGDDERQKAGWSIAFDEPGDHKLVLRNSLAHGGSGSLLRMDDSGIGVGGAREAFWRGYQSMSDIDTGTRMFPPPADWPNGGVVRKSATLNATARPWIIVATQCAFWLWIEHNAGDFSLYGGGDYASFIAGDWPFFLACAHRENNNGNCALAMAGHRNFLSPTTEGGRGLYLGTSHDFVSGAVSFTIPAIGAGTAEGATPTINNVQIGGSAANMTDPSPGSTRRFYMPALIAAEGTLRGRLPGLYAPLNDLSGVTDGTYDVAAEGMPVGSKLILLRTDSGSSTGSIGCLAVETALAW